jgi:hypothetical protein
MEINKTNVEEAVRELLDFLEENNICDNHQISWITDEDCYIEGERSPEMQELIQKVHDCIGEE